MKVSSVTITIHTLTLDTTTGFFTDLQKCVS